MGIVAWFGDVDLATAQREFQSGSRLDGFTSTSAIFDIS